MILYKNIFRLLNQRTYRKTNLFVSILGVRIYSKRIKKDIWGTETKYSWLGGILTLRKDSQGAQRMRFCGITFYSKRNKNGFRTTRLFWVPFHIKNLKKELLDRILQNIDDKYDSKEI